MAYAANTFTNTQTGIIHTVALQTGAATDQIVIADPGDGFTILLLSIYWSSAVQSNIFLEQGSTKVAGQFAAIDGGREHNPYESSSLGGRQLAASTSLTLTTSGAGNLYLELVHEIIAV